MKKKNFLIGLVFLSAIFGLAACKKEDTPTPNPPIQETDYTVYFNTQGGSSVASQKVESGKKATRPADPTKEGCEFAGWYKESACEHLFDFNVEIISGETTIYAKWDNVEVSPDVFNISFETKYDSTPAMIIGVKVIPTLPKLASTEYKFEGWFTDEDCTVRAVEGTTLTKSITLYAKWTKIDVTEGFEVVYYTEIGTAPAKVTGVYALPTILPVLTATGYTFGGWYLDSHYNTKAVEGSTITEDTPLYAKWTPNQITPPADTYDITYVSEYGTAPAKGNASHLPANLPVLTSTSHTFIGWFTDEDCTVRAVEGAEITKNITLYAKWSIKVFSVIFQGTSLDEVMVDYGSKIERPEFNPTRTGYDFGGWYEDNTYRNEFDFENTIITKTTSIFAKWISNGGSGSGDIDDNVSGGSGEVTQKGAVQITDCGGLNEAAYILFDKVKNETEYNVYLKNSSGELELLDERIVYVRAISSSQMRADLTGLKEGHYEVMIAPKNDATAEGSICEFSVAAYDRSGYAHFNYTEGVGGYKDDGTLKDNAIVLYVTDENKNTVTLNYKGTSVSGIGNILNSAGQKCGDPGHEDECKRVSKGNTYYGKGNENAGILKKLADDNIPLVIRFVGCVSDSGLYKKGTFNASSASLINGLTSYSTKSQNINDYGAIPGDNGHMARMKSGKNITLEGIGEDAIIDGWGFHFICETANPVLGKSFETRNLIFINTPEDALGMEGVQANGAITAGVERCWIHNNEFYGPNITSPAESDKGEGDGSCDFKRGQYFTCSYNYFEGCHKTNLVGSADDSLQYNLTYHHNYWKLCKARGPLARNSNIHMYNNVFEGQTDYAMNTRANAFIYSEYNLFYMCKSPQRVDSGAIKSFNDSFSSCINLMNGTIVNDKSTPVSNNCKYGSIDYSKFELNPAQSYIPTGNYQLQTNITDARKVIAARAGVIKDNFVAPKDVTLEQLSLLSSSVKPVSVSVPSTIQPGKISKTAYAFTIDRMATVTVSYAADTLDKTGVLVNLAGECFLTASGSVVLKPGTYMIQPANFQPGDSKQVTSGTFKEITVNSVQFEEYSSAEFDQQLIEDYDAKANRIPQTITYNTSCYQAIEAAREAYALLSPELREKVTVPYTKVSDALAEYASLGKAHVEGLISAIGTVNKDSGRAIASARAAYETLRKYTTSISIANYDVLVNAEKAFHSFAVDSCIEKINLIGTVTLDSEDLIVAARQEYDSLDEEQMDLITNYNVLVNAEKALEELKILSEFNALLDEVDMSSLNSLKDVIDAYNQLTSQQKQQITAKEKLSNVLTTYLVMSIDSIGTVDTSKADIIVEAENLYKNLSAEEKEKITNIAKLEAARTALDDILSQQHIMTFDNGIADSNNYFTVSGNLKGNAASKTYNGVTYTTALKMESSTSIKFTTNAPTKLVIVASKSGNIKVNGTSYSSDSNGIFTIDLTSAGTFELKKDTSFEIYAVIVG